MMGKISQGVRVRYTAQQFIAAIPGSGGLISTIARRVGCCWRTAKRYIVTYSTIQAIYQDECESILDMTEAELIRAIRKPKGEDGERPPGDPWAIKFMLATKGKDRGFYEKREIKSDGSLEITVKYGQDNPEPAETPS